MKLWDLAVCTCDEVVEIAAKACPSCTGSHFIPLTQLVDPLQSREEINLVRFIESEDTWA